MKIIPCFLVFLFFLPGCTTDKKNENQYILIKGGALIDPANASNDVKNAYVLIEDRSILETGKFSEEMEVPPGTKIIDAKGKYILPGLIDGFAVMNNQFYANAFLYSGVTSIIGVDGGRRGWFYPTPDPGPDFYMLESVGDEIQPDSIHLHDLHALYKDGYKIALLKYKLTPQQVNLIHEEAKKLGMGTIGELGYTTYREGGDIGIDAFVHTTRYSLDVAPEEMRKAVANFPFSNDMNSPKWKYYRYLYQLDTSDAALHQHANNLAVSNTYLMPTISLLYGDLPDVKNPWKEKVAGILNPADINNPLDKRTGKHDYTKKEQENYTAMGLQELKIETIYQKSGARYLAGSGTDVWGTMPGISLHTELELLQDIGLTNREAIAAATVNFSDAFGWETGKLSSGYDADILLLNKNPLENIENLKDIYILINNGKQIRREDLLSIPYNDSLSDGTILFRKTFDPLTDTSAMNLIYGTKERTGKKQKLPEFDYLDQVVLEEAMYMSDGFRVKAFLAYPEKPGTYPVIIYNRGGNREFGKISPKRVADVLGRIAAWGYIVAGSQYRGVDGGDGQEEFGGADLNDVMNLISMLHAIPQADVTKIGMYGRSRGGMMTYLTMTQTDKIKAAVVVGGVTDLQLMNDSRKGIMEHYVYSQLIPGYWQNKDSLLWERSAINKVDKMSKKTPFLIMHGTADWRVLPEESYQMANAFQKEKIPYRLVMFEGADHGLTEFNKEAYGMIRTWFDRYLINEESLPDLNPHGR